MALIMVTVLASCSKNDTPVTTDSSDENGFKKLASIELSSTEGTKDSIPGTRTPASVNEDFTPTTIYYGSSVNLLAVSVTDTLSQGCNIENYTFAGPKVATHEFTTSDNNTKSYDLYYKLSEITDNENNGGSLSGTITLSTDEAGNTGKIDIKLTTFKLEDLKKIDEGKADRIKGINNFYYGGGNSNGIGNVLFYLTYNPEGGSISLPEINKSELDFLKDDSHQTLYDEYTDKLFVSEEILIAATKDKVYVLKTLKEDANKGYIPLRIYDRNDILPVSRLNIDMARLTTIVNASFFINDTYYTNKNPNDPDSYFDEESKENSLKKFGTKFNLGFELLGIECPHATIDGVATNYDINNRDDDKNTSGEGRMVLWSSNHEVTGINGQTYKKQPEFTNMSIKVNANDVYKGLGMFGNSYSVIFKGKVYNGSKLQFYAQAKIKTANSEDEKTVNIKVFTEMTAFTLMQNTVHQLILLVDAETFANELKAIVNETRTSRTNSNDYIEIEVPSENLIIN